MYTGGGVYIAGWDGLVKYTYKDDKGVYER